MNWELFMKGIKEPLKGFEVLKLLAKGYYYKLKYTIFNKKIQIGKNFKVSGRLLIGGPGRVIIGDNVSIEGMAFPVTPWTSNPEAEIIIGNNVFINSARFGCSKKIEIGDNCIIADCRILDSDYHSVYAEKRNDPQYIESLPIKIGNNVWITMGCVILKGVTIGDNSTITALSVVCDDVDEYSVYGGNPAKLIRKLPKDDF
jgi:acetyltransferase-like isoleucine patch superfamily enzyme